MARVEPTAGDQTPWATSEQIRVDEVVTGVGCVLNGHRRTLVALLRDPAVCGIVVGHRDRFCECGPRWPRRAECWSWWTPLRLMTT